jgi:hypothetical protein
MEIKMGTSQTQYVVVGIKVSSKQAQRVLSLCPEFSDEAYYDNSYDKKITAKNGLTIIQDGMSGKYIVIGKVLAKGDESEGLKMTFIELENNTLLEVLHKIWKSFPALIDREAYPFLTNDIKSGVFVFTHWH